MTSWLTNLSRSVKRLIAKFFSLSHREQSLLIKALILLWAVRMWLWISSFQSISKIISTSKLSLKQTDLSEERIIWAVRVTCKFVFNATCLTQAIAAKILLSNYGYGSNLRIGVARDNKRLKGHAWLEKDGRVIIGGPIHDFKPLSVESNRS